MAKRKAKSAQTKKPAPAPIELSEEVLKAIEEIAAKADAAALEAGASEEDAAKAGDEAAAIAKADAEKAAAAAKAPKGPKLVKMARDPEAYPEPHTADVHPDEVENWLATGFRPVEE